MPTIVDREGNQQEVSTAEYARLMQQLESGAVAQVLTPTAPLDPALSQYHTRFWDCVEQAWTGPLPKDRISEYMSKRVVKCSACDYTSNSLYWTQDSSVTSHVRNVMDQEQRHRDAKLSDPIMTERGVGTELCSGCGLPFQVGKGMEHIIRIRGMSVSHIKVEALLMNRFALSQSEPIIYDRKVVVGPVAEVVPETPPSNGSRRKRSRRGKRSSPVG